MLRGQLLWWLLVWVIYKSTIAAVQWSPVFAIVLAHYATSIYIYICIYIYRV